MQGSGQCLVEVAEFRRLKLFQEVILRCNSSLYSELIHRLNDVLGVACDAHHAYTTDML